MVNNNNNWLVPAVCDAQSTDPRDGSYPRQRGRPGIQGLCGEINFLQYYFVWDKRWMWIRFWLKKKRIHGFVPNTKIDFLDMQYVSLLK